jgi:hypothetical protein
MRGSRGNTICQAFPDPIALRHWGLHRIIPIEAVNTIGQGAHSHLRNHLACACCLLKTIT